MASSLVDVRSMLIACDTTICFPRSVVWDAYRDHLTDLLPYLPNIRSIEVTKREQEEGVVRLVNVWHGGGDIPTIARAVMSEAMLAWTDHATWRNDTFECEWVTETHAFTEAVKSQGKNRYLEIPSGTRLQVNGDLTIDASKIKGVPKLLAGKVGRAIEEFLVKTISKNILDVSKGLEQYLKDQR